MRGGTSSQPLQVLISPRAFPRALSVDAKCVDWLESFLAERLAGVTMLLVSHDRSFLEAVATDMTQLRDRRLHYFAGGFVEWEEHEAEMRARGERLLDAQGRQEEHLKRSMESARARGNDAGAKAKARTRAGARWRGGRQVLGEPLAQSCACVCVALRGAGLSVARGPGKDRSTGRVLCNVLCFGWQRSGWWARRCNTAWRGVEPG